MTHLHLNLDDAWTDAGQDELPLSSLRGLDLRNWAAKLRYHGTRAEVESFYREVEKELTPFVLYGSGDYHYLAGVLLRRVSQPVTVISCDNHPDWDIRPPHWACGGWVNRALEMPNVRRVAVWGCGNFELAFPSRLFANQKALRAGRLEIHAWAERQQPSVQRRFNCMTRENWRDRFDQFARLLAGQQVYVTVDLDCLRKEEAVTNWENGLFTADDIAWALRELRSRADVVAGDLCGAYSPPTYARWFQRFAGNWDHPKLPPIDLAEARRINLQALKTIWPALTASNDQQSDT
jgi:arginase family enzyme